MISCGDRSFVSLNHFPKRPKGVKVYKQPANQVRHSIVTLHDKSRHFDWLLIFDGFDAIVRVKDRVKR